MGTSFHHWLQLRLQAQGIGGPASLATLMREHPSGARTDRRTAWRWCSGHRLPHRDFWPALAYALDVPVDQLALRVVGVQPLGPPAGGAR